MDINNAALDRMYDGRSGYELPADQRPAFAVKDKEGAIWALRKLSKIKRELAENNAAATAEIERIRAWQRGEEKRLAEDIAYFEGLLTDYHRRILEADPKAKTIKLPHGKLMARAQQPEYTRDDEKLTNWLKANGREGFVLVKEYPDWVNFKKMAVIEGNSLIDPATGEIVDGVTVTERPDKFSVEVE